MEIAELKNFFTPHVHICGNYDCQLNYFRPLVDKQASPRIYRVAVRPPVQEGVA